MRRKIPNHVDIVLEKAQIDPRGIVIVEIAQFPLIDELADLLHRAGKEKRVVHHDLEVFLLGQLDQLLSLSHIRGKGLFDENVLSVFQGSLCQFEMRPDGSDDGHGIDAGRTQDFRCVRGDLHTRKCMSCALLSLWASVAYGNDLRANQGRAGF